MRSVFNIIKRNIPEDPFHVQVEQVTGECNILPSQFD
jgi:hypothetical protein